MNLPLTIGIILLAFVCLAIGIEIARINSKKRRRQRATIAPPRRSAQLEKRMVAAFEGPRKAHGDIFAEFSVWRQLDFTRMDVRTKPGWRVLDLFSRSLTVRHLWHTLSGLVNGKVIVNIDLGSPHAMIWSAKQTEDFNDCGVVAPWQPSKSGRVGTLISGP
jgi:hypothetical protein